MICSVCGYIQADSERVCRRCGHIIAVRHVPARMESKLPPTSTEAIGAGGPFPREVQSVGNVPAWRAELSARVRQVKARRMMESELEAARRDQRSEGQHRRRDEHLASIPPLVDDLAAEPLSEAVHASKETPLDNLEAVENPLVRGALQRVRRAAESPRPVTFPPRRVSAAAHDTLTLNSSAVVAPPPAAPPVDIGEIAGELDAALGDFDLLLNQPPTPATTPAPAAPPSASPVAQATPAPLASPAPTRVLRRIRPLVRERALAGLIDAAVVALSCLPLLCVVVVTGVTLVHPGVAAILASSAALIAGMYLFGTVTVAGQTFGMMYMGLRVVSIYEDHELTAVQALLRTIGCGVSLLPLGAGFLWVLIDRNQRGWHEYVSATQLVREWYVELPSDDKRTSG
ncbi:MAG: RDD family protein [Chloracidobacterium sp.]|nr:RDD family protein [Chloracidobacterium sp.]